MYSLFSDIRRHYGGGIVLSWFKETSARIAEDVEHVIDYHQTGAFAVKTHHFLVKLIETMHTPFSYELDHYYEHATARALLVANTMEMTTAINAGRWHEGIFYHGCKELIIGHTNDDKPDQLFGNWRRLQPVKVLDCPISNLVYRVPDGAVHNTETGYATIGIDIPMLMVMYRGFVFYQKQKNLHDPSSEKLGTHHFVGRYVLPNMLYSQTDVAIINRLINLQTGAPMGTSVLKQPFHISDYTHWLDRGLNELLRRINTLRMEYSNVLSQIPSVFNDHAWQMPDIAETRQVEWALFATRFKLIDFLVEAGGENGKRYNQQLINTQKIDLKRFKSENVLEKRLPVELYDDILYFSKHL